MGATFVITLREGFEAALLLGIVYACVDRIGRTDGRRWVSLGAVAGLAASLAMGAAVLWLSGPLIDLGPDLIAAAVMFLAVGLLTWHGWWMRQHARAIRGDVERRIGAARAARRVWVVGVIAFTGVFREGAETVLFLWGLLAQATESSGWLNLAGGVAGLGCAAALGWAIFHGGKQISLSRFFAITTALVIVLAAGLFSSGVGRLQGLGMLPQGGAVWDTSAVLSDRGVIGGFLGGLVGYRAAPSAFEVAAWLAYLVVATLLIFPELVPRRASRAVKQRAA
jgi:high-affinity iron transporter